MSKMVANAVVRFLSSARVINAHPGLAPQRLRGGSETPADAACIAAEAAIASGQLVRQRVAAHEAQVLPPGVFVTTGRAVRLVQNRAGFKGVRLSHGGQYLAELFDGPKRYNLGLYPTAEAAAAAYDKGARLARRPCVLRRARLTRRGAPCSLPAHPRHHAGVAAQLPAGALHGQDRGGRAARARSRRGSASGRRGAVHNRRSSVQPALRRWCGVGGAETQAWRLSATHRAPQTAGGDHEAGVRAAAASWLLWRQAGAAASGRQAGVLQHIVDDARARQGPRCFGVSRSSPQNDPLWF